MTMRVSPLVLTGEIFSSYALLGPSALQMETRRLTVFEVKLMMHMFLDGKYSI